MQTLISIRRRGWSGRIASLPLSGVSFLFLVSLPRPYSRTVRQIWTNEGSKRVVPLKEVPFGGLNDVSLNFGNKIPQKNWNFAWTRKKFKSLYFENYLADHDKIFTRDTRHEWGFVCGPMAHPDKSKMAPATIFNFQKNVNNSGLDKDICTKFHGKLIPVTSSNEGLKHMCVNLSDYNRYLNQLWYRTQIPHYQHAGLAKFT